MRLLIANLFGFALRPTSIAFLTDHVFADPASIDLSLAIVPAALLLLGAAVATFAISRYEEVLRRAN